MDQASSGEEGNAHRPGVTVPDVDDTTMPFIFGMAEDTSDAIVLTDASITHNVRSNLNNLFIVIIKVFI